MILRVKSTTNCFKTAVLQGIIYLWIFQVCTATSRSPAAFGIKASSGTTTPLPTNELARSCPVLNLLEHESAACNVQGRGSTINCTAEPSPENTIAKIRCRKFWSPAPNGPSLVKRVCMHDGSWISENKNFSCELDCGFANYESGPIVEKGSSPWVAGIFYTEDSRMVQQRFKFACVGTLVSRRAVLTAAQCVTFQNTSIDRRPENLKVALGNFYRSYSKNGGLYHDVEKVVLHHEYNVSELGSDLALVWLSQPVTIDAYHHPICLPDEDEEVDIGTEGKITVLAGEALSERSISVLGSSTCRQSSSVLAQQLRSTKLCTQSKNDQSVCTTFGTGLAFPHVTTEMKWTLQGIRTGRLNASIPLDCRVPLLFTKTPRFRAWIDKELNREPPIYADRATSTSTARPHTRLPSRTTVRSTTSTSPSYPREREPLTPEPFLIPHYTSAKPFEVETLPNTSTARGTVTVRPHFTRPTVEREAERIPSTTPAQTAKNVNKKPIRDPANTSTVLPIRHQSNFEHVLPTRFPISTPRNRYTDRQTSTTPYYGPPVSKTTGTPSVDLSSSSTSEASFHCTPLPAVQGVSQVCKHDDYEDIDDCSNGGQVGTVATLKCESYYKAAFGPSSLRKECMANKRWSSPRPFACQLECGISSSPRKSFIVNGIISDRVSWPWHGTIFKLIDGDFRYICGGTLISKSLLLTAAHCLTKPMTTQTVQKEDFRIVLAAKSSNYTENLFDRLSQPNVFYVKKILIPDTYNGVTFESDIALIQLEFSVQLSDYVKPVCFPFQSKENSDIVQLHLSPGTKGQIVGFGIDQTGHLPGTMRETSLPVVSHRACGEVLARFPSSSMFCAGYLNGSSAVCNGDSGSGLFFSEGTGFSNRYIVQGIVSYGDHIDGSRVCNHESYAVFTKVSSFASWVQHQLDHLEPEYR